MRAKSITILFLSTCKINQSISIKAKTALKTVSYKGSAQEYSVFPNPVNDHLNVSFKKETSALISIYSATGNVLYKEEVKGLRTSIDLSDLNTSSIILVKISAGNRSEVFKVLVR